MPLETIPGMAAGSAVLTARTDEFVVQVGAFRSEQRARRAAAEFGLPKLVIIPTRREGEDWYVVLLGAFPDLESAQAAGQAFVEVFPGAGYWPRNAAAVRRILKP
jgi:septal ring-binding cell division protein DamX